MGRMRRSHQKRGQGEFSDATARHCGTFQKIHPDPVFPLNRW